MDRNVEIVRSRFLSPFTRWSSLVASPQSFWCNEPAGLRLPGGLPLAQAPLLRLASGSSPRRKQHEVPMHLTFPWQRRASQETGEATPPRRSPASPSRFAFARPPKTRSPSPQRRSPTKEPVQMAPTESAEFAAAAGSATSVDERTLRTLLMRQPAAKELGLTDDALMDSFVRSCAVSSKPSPDSPSSVVSPGPRARYTCAQYLRVVADLSQYRHDVRLGTLLVGNGRSVLQNNAGGLVDNYGAVVRFNDYQTEGRPPALTANP